MKKVFSVLALVLFLGSSLNANSMIKENLSHRNCVEFAQAIEEVMTDGGFDVDIFGMAFWYCKENMAF